MAGNLNLFLLHNNRQLSIQQLLALKNCMFVSMEIFTLQNTTRSGRQSVRKCIIIIYQVTHHAANIFVIVTCLCSKYIKAGQRLLLREDICYIFKRIASFWSCLLYHQRYNTSRSSSHFSFVGCILPFLFLGSSSDELV